MLVRETWDVATPILRIPEGATYFAIPLGGVLIVSVRARTAAARNSSRPKGPA